MKPEPNPRTKNLEPIFRNSLADGQNQSMLSLADMSSFVFLSQFSPNISLSLQVLVYAYVEAESRILHL